MKFLVGTSGWSYPAWKGIFYPAGLPSSRMLAWYAERFPVVEVNATFYRMPTPAVFATWRRQVPHGFTFALKAPRRITHEAWLAPPALDRLSLLLKSAAELGDALGPVLFQLPPWVSVNLEALEGFLESLPSGLRAAFEFRHPTWFSGGVLDALHAHDAALCVSESDKLATPLVPTAGWGYVRLRRSEYGEEELDSWAQWIASQPWAETFVFLKHDEGGLGPRRAARLTTLLAAEAERRAAVEFPQGHDSPFQEWE